MVRALALCVLLVGCGDEESPAPVCVQPPSSRCEGAQLVSYQSPGTWDGGRCLYAQTTRACLEGCAVGRCNEDDRSWGWISFIELNDTRLNADWQWDGGVRARFAVEPHWLLWMERTAPSWSTHVATEGDCSLYDNPFVPRVCDPLCTWDQECVVDGDIGECVELPPVLNVGALSIRSDSTTIEMTADERGRYAPDTTPMDLFSAGAAVTATAAGGDVTGFEVAATGVAPLEIDSATVVMRSNTASEISWTAADPGARIQVVIVSGPHHPSKPLVVLVCDLPDEAGTVSIAAPLVTGFLERTYLWNRFSYITRYRTGEITPHSGPVQLLVGSARALDPDRN